MSGKINPDLVRERSKASFNVEELTNLLDGGKVKTARRRYLENIIIKDPVFDRVEDFFLNRTDAYEKTLKRGLRFNEITKEHNVTDQEDLYHMTKTIGGPMPFNLNNIMFIPAIKNLGTQEQQAKWIPLAENFRIIGTYAQTELGHGTNIRALETIATYDKTTQEFVMHSPRLSACKWWPGNLGHSSTHAIVVAQLIVDGKEHGIHFFMTQLRDLNNHKPLPGITVGDIGPKASAYMNASDNGFLLLDRVRIPRENMLMGITKVSPDGKVSHTGNSKLLYGTMMLIRAGIPTDMFAILSRAITITVRYSAVRRQSELKPGEGEIQVIDFKTQQYKLLPILAATYAMKCASSRVLNGYFALRNQLIDGNYLNLPEMHASSSSLKAFCTHLTLRCAEECRLLCGGHGYSVFSTLPEIYNIANAACTYEGENKVLYLQVARYLLKCVSGAQGGQNLPSTVAYLSHQDNGETIPASSMKQFLDPSVQLQVIQKRSRRMIYSVAEKMQAQVMTGMEQMDAWNANSPDLLKCAQAHAFYLMVLYYTDFLRTGLTNISESIRKVLKSLSDLYVLHEITENSGSFLEVGVLNISEVGLIKSQVNVLINELRPDAVPLVDAFDHSDFRLSPLGRYDGNVYEQLFEWAQRSPLNKQPVLPAYHKYLKPLLQNTKSKL